MTGTKSRQDSTRKPLANLTYDKAAEILNELDQIQNDLTF